MQETLIITDELTNWTPNIAELGERLIMGPQKDVLQRIEDINSMYGLSLGITKTYRWKSGYMDQIKEYMATKHLEPHMKRKISTYFNQIDGKIWMYNNFRDRLNTIDNKMLNMRRRKAVFQNNTDIIQKVWDALMAKFNEELEGKKDYFNVYIGHYKFEFNEVWRTDHEEIDKKCIVFKYSLPTTTCNYYIGETPYSIPIYETTLIYAMDLDDFLCRVSGNMDWLEDKSQNIIDNNSSTIRYGGYMPHLNQWQAAYHREYINEVDGEDMNGWNQLLHPYISNDEFYRSNQSFEIVADGEDFTEKYKMAYACLGNFQRNISNSLSKLALGEIYAYFYNWHTVFNATSTHPMNSPKTMFFGMHKGMDTKEFQNVIPTTVNDCQIKSKSISGPKTYCDDYECLNRSECSYYNYDPDKAVADSPEDIIEDAQWNPENIMTQADRFPETAEAIREIHPNHEESIIEEANRINRDLGLTDDGEEVSVEERMIIWAAQQGGALNIANNERNENG